MSKGSYHQPQRKPSRLVSLRLETDDGLRLYLEEIRRYPLLDPAQEQGAVRRLHELRSRVAGGENHPELLREFSEILDVLVRHNLRLVVSIATRFQRRGLPLPDLIQEGNRGLLRAAQQYDVRKGAKFATYATWWVRQAIFRALDDQSSLIRLPSHAGQARMRFRRAEAALAQRLEREPSLEEVARECHISAEAMRRPAFLLRAPLSLDWSLQGEEPSALSHGLEDTRVAEPVDALARQSLGGELRKALEDLPERERIILRMRFGIDGAPPQTLNRVARHLGITRERVRQIEMVALARLRRLLSLRDPSSE